MRIALAYPYEGAKPDDVIEVSDELGRLLVRDGKARLAPRSKVTHKVRRTHPAPPAPPTTSITNEEAV